MTLRLWRVQGSIQATTLDGWQSSRQLKTMIVGADDPSRAGANVSHLAWDMIPRGLYREGSRRSVLTVSEVSAEGDPLDGHTLTWLLVAYSYGGISTVSFDTYAALCAWRDQYDSDREEGD